MSESRVVHRRVALAIVLSAALVAAAPFLGEARSQLRRAVPDHFSLIVNGAVGLGLLAAVIAGLSRIREWRWARYTAMAIALAAGAAYDAMTGSPDPNVRAVERIHFVQFGIITLLFYRAWRDRLDISALAMPVLAAFTVGIAEEAYQWFIPARVGELRDVWLNGVAIGCGLLFAGGLEPPAPFTLGWKPGSRRRSARLLALVVVALAAFVHTVHLGREIRDPEIGVFGTRFTIEELAEAASDRAARWKTDPPLIRPPRLSREDQYTTEGLQHVQARNAAWTAGDVKAAWRENLILEKYYRPVLETPSYVDKGGHRWHPDHRADAEARAEATAGQPYVSAAYPYPLYYWPPWAVWLVALMVAAALLLA